MGDISPSYGFDPPEEEQDGATPTDCQHEDTLGRIEVLEKEALEGLTREKELKDSLIALKGLYEIEFATESGGASVYHAEIQWIRKMLIAGLPV